MRVTRVRHLLSPTLLLSDRDPIHSQRKWLPRRLLLVRHGESIANVHREVYSSTPDWHIPLTAQGREQARDCGRRLRKIIGDEKLYIYYSPYERTKQTLHEIRKSFSDAQIQGEREDERLREQEIGNYQPMSSMDKYWGDRARFSRLYYRFPDGESSADVGDRVSAFFDSLLRERLGLAVPNMNDSFAEAAEPVLDIAPVDAWDEGYDDNSNRTGTAAQGEAGEACLASVHARWTQESGDTHVPQRIPTAYPPTSSSPSSSSSSSATDAAAPRVTSAATHSGSPLHPDEAAAVHAWYTQESGDANVARPLSASTTTTTTTTTPPALETTTTTTTTASTSTTAAADPVRRATFSASSPSSRWHSGSGPARMSHQTLATSLAGASGHPVASSSVLPPNDHGDTAAADDQNVVIVSHGLLVRLFIGRWFRVPMEVFETMSNPPNCSIIVLERDDTHERLVMTDMSKSLFGSDPLLQMMKFDGKEDTQWYRERFLGIIDPELSPHAELGEDDDENHYSQSTKHNSALGAPVPHPRPLVRSTESNTSTSEGAKKPTRTSKSGGTSPQRPERLSVIDRYYDTKK